MAPEPSAPQQATKSQAPLVLGILALVIVAALAGLIVWATTVSNRPFPAARKGPGFERFEPGWSSAMTKAGVEATFPAGPAELAAVTPAGRAPFEATFTAEEITALLNVYTHDEDLADQGVSLAKATVSFPAPGVGALSGALSASGSVYEATIEGPVEYSAKGIDSPGATALTVEGFSVGGERRRQATDAVVAYLNLYLQAAPGLTVESAEIVDGGLHVKGAAPARLEHPVPTPE